MIILLCVPIEPVGGHTITTESVTHDECNSRPSVTFPAAEYYHYSLISAYFPFR